MSKKLLEEMRDLIRLVESTTGLDNLSEGMSALDVNTLYDRIKPYADADMGAHELRMLADQAIDDYEDETDNEVVVDPDTRARLIGALLMTLGRIEESVCKKCGREGCKCGPDCKCKPVEEDTFGRCRIGEEEDPDVANFTIDNIKKLEHMTDLTQMKAYALELISNKGKKSMKPVKVSWFERSLERMNSRAEIIKLMYDLYLSGEGNAVIGDRYSTKKNSYRRAMGEGNFNEDDMLDYETDLALEPNPKNNWLILMTSDYSEDRIDSGLSKEKAEYRAKKLARKVRDNVEGDAVVTKNVNDEGGTDYTVVDVEDNEQVVISVRQMISAESAKVPATINLSSIVESVLNEDDPIWAQGKSAALSGAGIVDADVPLSDWPDDIEVVDEDGPGTKDPDEDNNGFIDDEDIEKVIDVGDDEDFEDNYDEYDLDDLGINIDLEDY